ncbi:MAG: hypothetical protein A2Z34_12065 [Planctomycetes bacterium RBG_16_59_8]|nr:MAG: hypothetical protein A2Z34_12065 [Planctomycetes bacterium RBG_16_59_8]
MLTYESLMADAASRGMPAGKSRGILREYLQLLTLRELYHLTDGRKFFFTGGTYLRLVHQTKRFSEDLDFNVAEIDQSGFENVMRKVLSSLGNEGLTAKLDFAHWGNLFVAELIFPDVEKTCGIRSAYSKKEGILIKVEANRPRWKIKRETLVVAGFGYMFPVVCTERGALFADKIDALVNKNRARHLFDILFMLSRKYQVDTHVLESLGIAERPFDVILKRVQSFSYRELKKQADSLRPFLFDEKEADIIVNAPAIAKQLIEQY